LIYYSSLTDSDTVLEIGPGLGTLTFYIAERVKSVIAVELDSGVFRYLKGIKSELGVKNITLINSDFLKLKLSDIYSISHPNKLISNFPYGIAIKSIIKVFDEFKSIKKIVGTVQKELAERLTAKPHSKNYSYVSVYIQFIGHIKILEKNISPKNFFPPPEVGSSIIEIDLLDESEDIGRENFKKIVKSSFLNRRKNLVNNLLNSDLRIDKDSIVAIVKRLFKNKNIRGEELSVEDFKRLAKLLINIIR